MKKRGKPLLWIGIGFTLLSVYIGLNLFVPGPPIEVSKQTTVITAPLGSKGLPHFGRYCDETQSKGVTSETNAAAIIWQAVGSCDLPTSDFVKICQAIGIEPVASSTERIVHINDKQLLSTLNKWLVGSTSANVLNSFESRTGAEQLLEQLMSRPWSGQQVPPMLKWIEEIQPRLDMLLDASMRPRYYSPSPSYLNNCDTPLPSMHFPDLHDDIVRSCVRDLHTRAMWHLGEGRPMSAWTDVHAGYRFSRLVSQGATTVHRLVAYAIEMMSCRATNTILDSRQLSPEEIQTITSDLDDLPQSTTIAQLTRTAAFLALYRAEHGMYPESLGQLVPSMLPTIPIDPFSEQPLIYERRNDGYLLYSVGKNGVDDNGVDVTGKINDGEWLNLGELPPGGRDVDNFDLVVRMPQPQFALPVPVNISQ